MEVKGATCAYKIFQITLRWPNHTEWPKNNRAGADVCFGARD